MFVDYQSSIHAIASMVIRFRDLSVLRHFAYTWQPSPSEPTKDGEVLSFLPDSRTTDSRHVCGSLQIVRMFQNDLFNVRKHIEVAFWVKTSADTLEAF